MRWVCSLLKIPGHGHTARDRGHFSRVLHNSSARPCQGRGDGATPFTRSNLEGGRLRSSQPQSVIRPTLTNRTGIDPTMTPKSAYAAARRHAGRWPTPASPHGPARKGGLRGAHRKAGEGLPSKKRRGTSDVFAVFGVAAGLLIFRPGRTQRVSALTMTTRLRSVPQTDGRLSPVLSR